MEDSAESGLEIVLSLVEEGGINPVGFAANGKTGVQAVVEADAGLYSESSSTVAGRLGLQVGATQQDVPPGLKPVAAAADADSAAAAKILHMLVDIDGGSETGNDVALDGEPTIREVANRGVGPNETGVDDV